MYKLEKIESSLIDTESIYKEIIEDPGKVFDLIRFDIRSMAERVLGELLKEEITHWLGHKRYQCSNEEDPNYRNGTTNKRYTVKNIRELKIKVPRDRKGNFFSKLVKKYERYEKVLEKDIAMLFLSGLSTRGIELISKSLLGRKISTGEVYAVNKELLSGIEAGV